MSNLNETIFGKTYMIAVDRPNSRVENITLGDLMDELDLIPDGAVPSTLSVVWHEKDNDAYIIEIYDYDSGEVYWEEPSDNAWSSDDDEITNALLMYGNLEQQIGTGSY